MPEARSTVLLAFQVAGQRSALPAHLVGDGRRAGRVVEWQKPDVWFCDLVDAARFFAAPRARPMGADLEDRPWSNC